MQGNAEYGRQRAVVHRTQEEDKVFLAKRFSLSNICCALSQKPLSKLISISALIPPAISLLEKFLFNGARL